jgi:hypothetical protein
VAGKAPASAQSAPAYRLRRDESGERGASILPLALVPCCLGAREPCVRQELGCGDGSETTVGFECDQKTNEPCAPGEIRRLGKVGRSPLTMTSVCEKP